MPINHCKQKINSAKTISNRLKKQNPIVWVNPETNGNKIRQRYTIICKKTFIDYNKQNLFQNRNLSNGFGTSFSPIIGEQRT